MVYVFWREIFFRYLIRSLAGKLRIGMAEQSVLQALAQACVMTPPCQDYPPEIRIAYKDATNDKFKEALEKEALKLKTAYWWVKILPFLKKKSRKYYIQQYTVCVRRKVTLGFYNEPTWLCNMSYEWKFCQLSEYVQVKKVGPLIKSTPLFKWNSVEMACAQAHFNLWFRGCLRSLWPLKSHISLFSVKYHISTTFWP